MLIFSGTRLFTGFSLLAFHCFLDSCKTSTALIPSSLSSSIQIDKLHQAFRLNMDALEIGQEGYTTANVDNPPFFPSTVEELAYDVAFTTKIALINRIKRIRVDVRMRLTSRDRYMLKWLLLTSINLLDDSDENSNVHLFIDKTSDVIRCQELWAEIVSNSTSTSVPSTSRSKSPDWQDGMTNSEEENKINKDLKEKAKYLNKLSKVHISPISDVHLRDTDSILLIFNPDNMHSCEHPDLLEDVQALCFHAALRKIPVVLINPQLMATAWNDYGARTPLLLSDFAQAYFICDDYFMFSRRDQWCGIVQRAASGFDLFLLEGFPSIGGVFPKRYTRLQNWPNGMPYDIKSYLRQLLTRDPNFPLKTIFDAEDKVNHGVRDVNYRADGTTYKNNDLKQKSHVNDVDDNSSLVIRDNEIEEVMRGGENGLSKSKGKKEAYKSGWRNIVPAPTRKSNNGKSSVSKLNRIDGLL